MLLLRSCVIKQQISQNQPPHQFQLEHRQYDMRLLSFIMLQKQIEPIEEESFYNILYVCVQVEFHAPSKDWFMEGGVPNFEDHFPKLPDDGTQFFYQKWSVNASYISDLYNIAFHSFVVNTSPEDGEVLCVDQSHRWITYRAFAVVNLYR